MKKTLMIITVIIFCVCLVIFLKYSPDPQQGTFSRNIIKPQLVLKTTFTGDNVNSIEYYNGNYFLNQMSNIIMLDNLGKVTGTLLKQDNNRLIIGFQVDSSGIYIQDARKKKFFKFSFKGDTLMQDSIGDQIIRSIRLDNGNYFYKTSLAAENFLNEKLKVYDAMSRKSTLINDVFPKTNDNGIGTDGFFIKTPADEVFHIYYYMSSILKFNKFGQLVGKYHSLDGTEVPPKAIETTGGHVPDPKIPLVHKAATIDNGILYIASNYVADNESIDKKSENVIIDRYDLNNLKYLNSFYIPKNRHYDFTNITIIGNKLITVTGGKFIDIYSFNI